MFKLVIQDDEGKTTIVPLIRDEITIGRKEGNTIRLTERNVSRRHARILRNNGEVQIEDLGSYNGIRVNNARIAERVSLRVSDQVQIGDYKLYLKAEGVEQVDEARTMPIERLEAVAATDQIPAVAAVPTAQMAAASPAMVGNPNRTLVAIADTDPQGRPVATAAALAALTTPVGYGKLVVLSSNFAGKEFELSRPQMIVGRTDENDIVVNHRSISRNHAKLVREPESGRYTISDLQSSNGVRVNGQDYGKVELRRGDVVDLGHVRLRFIEPGEDFVFSRDAVITDVPDVGGKRGLLVAIILGIVVLGGVAVFLLTHTSDPPKKEDVVQPEHGIEGSAVADASTSVAIKDPITPVSPDAATVAQNPPAGDLVAECINLRANKKWSELHTCGERLQTTDNTKGKEFTDIAASEMHAEDIASKIDGAVKSDSLREAKKLLEQVASTSVYHQLAQDKIAEREQKDIDDESRNANKMLGKHDCPGLALAVRQASSKSDAVADAVRAIAAKCVVTPVVDPAIEALRKEIEQAVIQANKLSQAKDCQGLKNLVATSRKEVADSIKEIAKACKVPVVDCDPTEAHDKGIASVNLGQYAAALVLFEQALACKGSPDTVRLAYLASCHSKNVPKAKLYFSRLSSVQQKDVQIICLREGIQVP